MKQPTRAEWNQLKQQRMQAAPDPQEPLTALPDDLFLPGDYQAPITAADGSETPAKRRQFARLDETWRATLLAAGSSIGSAALRLALVLIAKADFDRHIRIGKEIEAEASLTRHGKRQALQQLERLGLVTVEWRGQGRLPIVTPLHLSGRPGRK